MPRRRPGYDSSVASANVRFRDYGSAFPRSAHPARRIVRVSGNNDMIAMHLEQRSDEWEALKAAGHAVADDVPDLERRGIEVELEWAAFSHALHRSSPR